MKLNCTALGRAKQSGRLVKRDGWIKIEMKTWGFGALRLASALTVE